MYRCTHTGHVTFFYHYLNYFLIPPVLFYRSDTMSVTQRMECFTRPMHITKRVLFIAANGVKNDKLHRNILHVYSNSSFWLEFGLSNSIPVNVEISFYDLLRLARCI